MPCAGEPSRRLPRALLEDACGQALFGILAEGLADRFEPALCDVYARPVRASHRRRRTQRAGGALPPRAPPTRRWTVEPRVSSCSRASPWARTWPSTSVLLDAAKQRFPHARIVFVGPRKNCELFAADPRIAHAAVDYRRGTLRERLAVRHDLETLLGAPDALVIDSDSRLTQLGLLPVCPEERYHLFESRGYGGASDERLPHLAAAWAEETFGIARGHTALRGPGRDAPAHRGVIAVSLGVGENPAKRLPDPFEENLLALLAETAPKSASTRAPAAKKAPASSAPWRVPAREPPSGTVPSRASPQSSPPPSVRGLRLRRAARGGRRRCAADQHLRRLPRAADVRPLAPDGPRVTVIRVDRPEPAEILARVAEALAVIHD